MGINSFFNHKCEIYHEIKTPDSTAYSTLDSQSTTNNYPETPDITDLRCHFSTNDEGVRTTQGDPQRNVDWNDTLALPIGTDIRYSDKVVDLTQDITYTVEKPIRKIRNNHIKVRLITLEVQQDL